MQYVCYHCIMPFANCKWSCREPIMPFQIRLISFFRVNRIKGKLSQITKPARFFQSRKGWERHGGTSRPSGKRTRRKSRSGLSSGPISTTRGLQDHNRDQRSVGSFAFGTDYRPPSHRYFDTSGFSCRSMVGTSIARWATRFHLCTKRCSFIG